MVTSIPFLIARIADDNDFLRLKQMASVHDDWSLDYDNNDIKIWSKVVPDATVKMVKVWSVFSAISSVELYNTLMDPLYRKEWDHHMISGCDIGHLNPNNGISYYAVACPPPLRSRDFILQSSWLDRGSEHFILNHSVCHKDYPPKRGFIRAISYITGYFIKGTSQNGCEMSFVSQTDPQGVIPAWVVNKCTQIFAPKFVKQLEKAAFAYSEWKKSNSPDFAPWVYPEQITSPKITTADCVPCEEELQSPFFRSLLEKIDKREPVSPEDPTLVIKMSPIATAGPSNTPITSKERNGVLSKGTNVLLQETENKRKQKKSKTFRLDFAKLCFGKNSES